MSKNKKTVIILSIIIILIALIPIFLLKNAKFGGSDDAGSQVVSEITGSDYKPWFTPVMETVTGKELPSEVETLFFCIQTGIGTGIIFFFLGRFYERSRAKEQKES
ncbi:energy-coupling factor ABC transporter substrate-binding protein [Parasporobacterium paucivorans]|uniref:Cobalt transport protein CbiN n=1 Tax=Parasporobacterium paucivorans DSM 15970 TaxID=1122934 RepID=A0A1M6DS31_9FIRM|nr:cobalt transport protein CbiN [Parasporobacterium paucivorans]SHI76021.1 cobalt/nickel transport protein [Parasporobacterium paucivorans DSM 15970]